MPKRVMSWNDALYLLRVALALGNGGGFGLRCFRVVVAGSGNGVNVTSGKRPEPGCPAKRGKRLKSPLLTLFSCVPPTQSWFFTAGGASSGRSATDETRFSGP